MPILAHFTATEGVIQLYKVLAKPMSVRRYLFTKKTKLGITIARSHIAKHLVVRSVFSNDIKHVLDLLECGHSF